MTITYTGGQHVIVTGDTANLDHMLSAGTEAIIDGNVTAEGIARVRPTDPDQVWRRYISVADLRPIDEPAPAESEDPEKAALRAEVTRLGEQVKALAQQVRDSDWRLVEFKSSVRDAAVEHADSESHCKEGLNGWLEALGLDPVSTGWDYAIFDPSGNEILSGEIDEDEDIDDEDEAIEWVRDRISATVEEAKVVLSIEVEGNEGSTTYYDDEAVSDYWVESTVSDLDISVEKKTK